MILRRNSRNEQVRIVQEYLGIATDGIFGPITEQAVRKFQKENNLVEDGIVGPLTWGALSAATTDQTETLDYTNSGLLIHEHFLPTNEYFSSSEQKQWIFLHHTAGWNNPYKLIDQWASDNRGRIATEYVIGGQNIRNNNDDFDGVVVKAMPDDAYAWHLGIGNTEMHRNSIGIEICSFGYLTKGGYFTQVEGVRKWIKRDESKFYTYVGTEAHPDQVVKLDAPFRGYEFWHKYSEKQLSALKELLIHLSQKHNINFKAGLPVLIQQVGVSAFDNVNRQKCIEEKGVWSHTNVSGVKTDVFPQKELLELLLSF